MLLSRSQVISGLPAVHVQGRALGTYTLNTGLSRNHQRRCAIDTFALSVQEVSENLYKSGGSRKSSVQSVGRDETSQRMEQFLRFRCPLTFPRPKVGLNGKFLPSRGFDLNQQSLGWPMKHPRFFKVTFWHGYIIAPKSRRTTSSRTIISSREFT